MAFALWICGRELNSVTGPAQLPCLPLRFHVAQKLHGMTLPPRPGKQNERFRDLAGSRTT